MAKITYLGIDLTSGPDRPAAYSLLDDGAAEVELGYVAEDEALLQMVAERRPWAVAIDAPLGLPTGWECLEEPCSCGRCVATVEDRRRVCEVELRQIGIPCFWTTRRSIIKTGGLSICHQARLVGQTHPTKEHAGGFDLPSDAAGGAGPVSGFAEPSL
jgi:predicted nuclease with RNAse H fold